MLPASSRQCAAPARLSANTMQCPTPACRRNVSIRTSGKSGRPMASTAGVTSPAAGFAGVPRGRIVFSPSPFDEIYQQWPRSGRRVSPDISCDVAGGSGSTFAQNPVHCFSLGQLIDQLVQVADLSYRGFFDVLDPDAANHACDQG